MPRAADTADTCGKVARSPNLFRTMTLAILLRFTGPFGKPIVVTVTQANREPKVGIFWVFRGRLLSARGKLDDGVDSGHSIDSPKDHVSYWPVLQRRYREICTMEYEEVPRGRVVWVKQPSRFCVYMDKRLHTPRVKRLILQAFELPGPKTRFLVDPHYTTDPEELNRLFGDL